MAAWQDRHASARLHGAVEHAIGERSARVTRHDDVAAADVRVVERTLAKRHATGEARPRANERAVNLRARRRERRVHDERFGRRVVEQKHRLREQSMTRAKIHHAPAAK